MANNRPMLEVSSVVGGVEEGDEEIELSLGLSVGGSFRKSTKLKPEVEKTTNSCEKLNSESTDVDADPSRENQCLSRSSMVNLLVGDSEPESGSEYLDPQRKREIHALRRQAARKKREEKLGKGVGRGMNGGLMVASDFSDDKMWLEAQRLQNWVRDREMRENEANVAERQCKRDKKVLGNKCVVNEDRKDLNLTAKHNGAQNLSHGSSAAAAVCGGSPSPIPLVPVQYPYPALQYLPFANGFAYPCVMPCWAPTAGNVGNDKNVQQPVARRSFQPYQGNLNSGHNPLMGSDSEHNSGKDGGNQNAVSNRSPVCSSSVVSEHGSTSRQGGNSSDTGSHSSHCKPEQSQLNAASEQLGQSDHSVSSNQMESAQANGKAANYIKAVSPGIIQSSLPKLSEQTSSVTQPDPVEKHITSENPNPGPSKVASRDLSKPPKPETHSHDTAFFSQMPCVSTTGNGPNGKTITGFLYRYTKTEVSIICVCHGSSFSPAEFVEHAGGKDITHPLRHITVIPSALG